MSVPTTPASAPPETALPHAGRALTVWSYAVNLGYIAWFWVMFAGAYWVYSWFGLEAGTEDSLGSEGALGWLAAIGFGLVVALPSWVGAWLALRARAAGAGRAAAVSLVLNLVLAVGYLTAIVVGMLAG